MNRLSRLRFRWAVGVTVLTALLLTAFAAVGARMASAGTSTPAVKSAPAGENAYPRRITVCHRSGRRLKRSRYRTIRIPPRSRRGHLRHGDGVGPCSRARFTICHRFRRAGKVRRRTMTVRGWKTHRRHMRHGDKIRACPRKRR
jgi:hypothetical protein